MTDKSPEQFELPFDQVSPEPINYYDPEEFDKLRWIAARAIERQEAKESAERTGRAVIGSMATKPHKPMDRATLERGVVLDEDRSNPQGRSKGALRRQAEIDSSDRYS